MYPSSKAGPLASTSSESTTFRAFICSESFGGGVGVTPILAASSSAGFPHRVALVPHHDAERLEVGLGTLGRREPAGGAVGHLDHVEDRDDVRVLERRRGGRRSRRRRGGP